MQEIQAIEQHPVYKQIMADSFGGIMYNVANRNKYDTTELFEMWEAVGVHQESAGGIMSGAFNFLKGE